jgi:RNA polymerase sigma-B factor
MARRYSRVQEPLDDLSQVAAVGLIKAIERFDPERNTAFSSYAVPTMLGELKRYFRDSRWALHVPRGMQERVMQVDQAGRELEKKLSRTPSYDEIASATGLSSREVSEALQAAGAYDAVSLDAFRVNDGNDGETYGETIGLEDHRFELVDLGQSIAPTLQALPDRDRRILRMRFVEDLTQAQIAERVGVSQMHVSRLIRRTLTRLQIVANQGSYKPETKSNGKH